MHILLLRNPNISELEEVDMALQFDRS
jgi:hypothetical protein